MKPTGWRVALVLVTAENSVSLALFALEIAVVGGAMACAPASHKRPKPL